MLSAFTARSFLELKQRDKSKIETVLLHGDRLLTGLNTGALKIYRVNENLTASGPANAADELEAAQITDIAQDSAAKPVELLREKEKFSRYKVEQLATVKEANVLVSLSNGAISLHDLGSYDLQETLVKSKGASHFAVTSNVVRDQVENIPEIVSQLAVAVKRRLLVWTWRDGALSEDVQEISLASTVRTLTWITGTRLIAGLASNYVLVDVETSVARDIVGPGAIGGGVNQDAGRFSGVGVSSLMGGMGPMPLVTRLGEGQMLLAKDINTHFIDADGQSLGRRQVPWPQAPDAVGYSYPYLLALQTSKNALEIRNPETLSTLQTITLQNAKILHVPNPGVSLAHAGKGFLVASDRCIWRMDALGYDEQIDSLLELGKFDETISLLEMLEDALLSDKQGRLRQTKLLKAEHLFHQKRFRQAFDIFLDIHAPPEKVIGLYPSLISGSSSNQGVDAQAHVKGASEGELVDNKSAKDDADDTRSVTTKAETASLTGSLRKSKPSIDTESTKSLEGKDLKNAAIELNSFLVDTRTRIQRVIEYETGEFKDANSFLEVSLENQSLIRELDPDFDFDDEDHDILDKIHAIARLVDSALFRSYMFATSSLAGPLFRLPNFIDAEVAEEKLMESKRYNDLVELLYGKGLHRKALHLLLRFAKGEFADEEVPEHLRGPQRIVTYLQNVPPENIDLILDYIEWPMQSAPELAMDVFIADTRNAEHLPRHKVLDYLSSVDLALAAKYLEHVINELNEEDPELHQRLIQLYLESLQTAEGEQKNQQLIRLTTFLKTSRKYEPWRVTRMLSSDEPDLFEPRAIVLGRMQEHKQALEIYVFDMNDPEKAEDYCNQVWIEQHQSKALDSDGQEQRASNRVTATIDPEKEKSTVYHTLLSLYLQPRSPRKQQLAPALDLLARHGSRLPATSTLDLLPESLPVDQLESYFRGRMRAANAIYNQAKIVAGLRKTLDESADLQLRLDDPKGRNRSVIIQDDRVCGVCHRRFGAAAIKVAPDNTVTHYSCAAR